MRISSLNISQPAGEEAGVEEARRAEAQNAAEAAAAASRPEAQAPPRGGLHRWNPQVNQQLSTAQQALGFLQEAESRLQGLKSELSSKLAAGQAGDPKLEGKLREFADLWRQRQTVAGGSLDGRLGYSADTPARQRFKIKGLDRDALRSGGKETLAFSVGGSAQRLLVVALEPGLSDAEIVRRFDQAFAPAGIRVSQDDDGGLSFSVAESAWPTVQDTLAVKGAGIRFPTGQMTRVAAEAKPEAIRPGNWESGNAGSLRRTLQEVLDALTRVRQARETLARALADARHQLNQPVSPDEGNWAFSFAADFQVMAAQPAYEVYSAVAPALASISRDRVLSLLSLD
ncbi:MAG: hypothetical protein ACM31P_13530 [Actinomycetota bacterium]